MTGKRIEIEHHCKLPGWWKRRKLKLGVGSMVACQYCNRHWTLRRNQFSMLGMAEKIWCPAGPPSE